MSTVVVSQAARARRAAVLIGVGCASMLLTACSDRGPQRIPVSGTVTIDGRPVEDATIIFTPRTTGLAAAALIHQGRFRMSEIDGPTVGEHIIRINPNEGEMETGISETGPAGTEPTEAGQPQRRPRIPIVFQRPGELQATVTEDPQQELQFELSSPAS